MDLTFVNFYLHRRMAVAGYCAHGIVYCVFLVLLTVWSLSYVGVGFQGWETGKNIQRRLGDGSLDMGPGPQRYDKVTWKDIGDAGEFWDWLRADTGLMTLWGPDGRIEIGNWLVGGLIRMTQLRVPEAGCHPKAEADHPMFQYVTPDLRQQYHEGACYARGQDAGWDTAPRHDLQRCKAEYNAMMGRNASHALPLMLNRTFLGWEHWPSLGGRVPKITGQFGKYPVGSGYTLLLPTTTAQAQVKAYLRCMEDSGWTDAQTRFVSVQFALWRADVDLFTWCIYYIEVLPSGALYAERQVPRPTIGPTRSPCPFPSAQGGAGGAAGSRSTLTPCT